MKIFINHILSALWLLLIVTQTCIAVEPIVQVYEVLKAEAEKGDAEAQCNLGFMYASGRGVTKDEFEAAKWFRKASEQGDAKAQYFLGFMNASGRGVTKDEKEAVHWFRKAAEQGYAEAVNWLRKASEQGDAEAQYALGFIYISGRGVTKDKKQAIYWCREAAKRGNTKAQSNLGVQYSMGAGVAKDYVESYKWRLLAAAQGSETAKLAAPALEINMTREQIAEGQKLAREFKPTVRH